MPKWVAAAVAVGVSVTSWAGAAQQRNVGMHAHLISSSLRTLRVAGDSAATASSRAPTPAVSSTAGDSAAAVSAHDPFAPRGDSAAAEDSTSLGVAVAMEVHLASVGSTTIKGYDTGRRLYVPLSPMCQLVDLRCASDFTSHRLQLGERVIPVADSAMTTVHGTVYVSLDLWTRELHLIPTIDRDDASIELRGGGGLPAVREALRAAARAELAESMSATTSFDTPDELSAGQLDLRSARPQWGGLTLDYAMTNQRAGTNDMTTYVVGAASAFAGGSLIAQTVGTEAHSDQQFMWRKVWPQASPVTQLRVGQSFSSGLTSIPIRGVYASNIPYSEPIQLAIFPVTGLLPPQWSVDVFRGSTLVGYDSADASGMYDVPVPMNYGENPYTVVEYGPLGDSTSSVRVVHPLADMVPPGKVYYAGSAGACVNTACRGMANVDLRYGLSSRLTLRSGVTSYTLRGGAVLSRGYVGLSAVPGEPLGISLELMPGVHQRASASFQPNDALLMQANYVAYALSDAAAAESGASGLHQSGVVGRLTPWLRGPSLEMYVFRTSGIPGGAVTSGQVGVSVPMNGATFSPYLRRSIASGIQSDFRGVQITSTMLPPGLGRLAPSFIRGTFEWHTNGRLSYQEVVLSRPAFGMMQLDVGARWVEHLSGVRAVLGATLNLSGLRTVANATSATGGTPTQLLQMTTGSLRWDPQFGRVVPSADLSIDRAGVSGVVYLDANGNHRLDPGEQRLAGVTVRIGGTTTITNSRGEYQLWGLAAMTPVSVSVDTATFPQPWYAPSYTRLVVRPTLDRAAAADIPVMVGGIIEGAIVCDSGACPSFPPVVIVNQETGLRQRIETFSDGAFYRMGITPGSYVATVDSSAARAMGVTITATSFIVVSEETTHRITVVLHRTQLRGGVPTMGIDGTTMLAPSVASPPVSAVVPGITSDIVAVFRPRRRDG